MYIGIDLGGTNIAAALVDCDGNIKRRTSVSTKVKGGAKAITDGLLDVCEYLHIGASAPISSIGIGVPGAVNVETGEVVFTPNLPISRINLTRGISEKFKCPVILGNDANCAAVGELLFGGTVSAKNAVFITLGTGVGGSVIIDGKLCTGVNGAAGELGHMVTAQGGRSCGCGRLGCWESYASASGLIRTATEFIGAHQESLLWESCGGLIGKLDGRMVFEAFRAGDTAAALVVEQYIGHLGVGAVNIINMLEPEYLCIGGGISGSWDCIEKPLLKFVEKEKYSRTLPQAPQTKIVKAKLGNDAGIIGAAFLGEV